EPARLARVMQRQDVGVGEPGGQLDFPEEPLGAEGGGELGLQYLDRDLTVVLEVLGEVNCGHPAAPELTLDRVAVGEGGLQTSEQIGQGHSQAWDSSIIGVRP